MLFVVRCCINRYHNSKTEWLFQKPFHCRIFFQYTELYNHLAGSFDFSFLKDNIHSLKWILFLNIVCHLLPNTNHLMTEYPEHYNNFCQTDRHSENSTHYHKNNSWCLLYHTHLLNKKNTSLIIICIEICSNILVNRKMITKTKPLDELFDEERLVHIYSDLLQKLAWIE